MTTKPVATAMSVMTHFYLCAKHAEIFASSTSRATRDQHACRNKVDRFLRRDPGPSCSFFDEANDFFCVEDAEYTYFRSEIWNI